MPVPGVEDATTFMTGPVLVVIVVDREFVNHIAIGNVQPSISLIDGDGLKYSAIGAAPHGRIGSVTLFHWNPELD